MRALASTLALALALLPGPPLLAQDLAARAEPARTESLPRLSPPALPLPPYLSEESLALVSEDIPETGCPPGIPPADADPRTGCGGRVLMGAAAGVVAGFTVSLLYGLAVCLPKAFRDGEGCGGAVPVVLTVGGGALGAALALRSPPCAGRR